MNTHQDRGRPAGRHRPPVTGSATAHASAGPAVSLTPREIEVLALVRAGPVDKQIARKLGISDRTVKSHLSSVFAAIGVQDRTQAAVWAERHGIGDRRG